MTMSLGNVFIFLMQKEFGALAVAKTTTVRKLVSVVSLRSTSSRFSSAPRFYPY